MALTVQRDASGREMKWGPYRSSSNPNKSYWVQLNTTGHLSCQCQGYTMWTPAKKAAKKPRDCKHIQDVIKKEGFDVHAPGNPPQFIFLVNKAISKLKSKLQQLGGTPMEIFGSLCKLYEDAMHYMASLDVGDAAFMKAAQAVEEAKFKVEAYMTKLETLGLDGTATLDEVRHRLAAQA